MRRSPVRSALPPAYPDLVRSPWVLSLLAAGGVTLGTVALAGCDCHPSGVPVQVEPVPTPGEAPRIEPQPGQDSEPEVEPAPDAIPEVTPQGEQVPRILGDPPAPIPPTTEPEVPAVPPLPPEARVNGGLRSPREPEPSTP